MDKRNKSDLEEIKEQLQQMMALVPIVKELKEAYDASSVLEEEEEIGIEKETETEVGEEVEDGEICETIKYFRDISESATTKKGPLIHEDIASGSHNILCNGLKSEQKDSLHQKYDTPVNCERMAPILCNSNLYKKASNNIQHNDKCLQKVQETLMKGLSAMSLGFDKVLGASEKEARAECRGGNSLM